jgi:Tol biopolymer transport system component
MSPRRLKPLLAAVVLAAAVASVLPGTARPAYPGANGKLVFVSARDDPFGDIYTMSADGTGSVTRFGVDRIVDQTPAWSPDGTKIAFGSRRDLDDIYVMDADGGNVRRLTTDFATEYSPTWSPDGSKIAFVSDRDGNNEIYVMNADGTDQRRLTNYPGSDDEPAWSTGGTRIAFNSPRDGCFKEVYVMDAADGGNVTKLVPGCVFSADASWSPDGTKVAFDKGNGQRRSLSSTSRAVPRRPSRTTAGTPIPRGRPTAPRSRSQASVTATPSSTSWTRTAATRRDSRVTP